MSEIFTTRLDWTGAAQGAAVDPAAFSRDLVLATGPHTLPMSSAPAFRGDASRLNPEQLFVAALSACQALTYLFLAAKSGVAVTAYTDDAEGHLGLADGKLRMTRVTLRPRITLQAGADEAQARALVDKAHRNCFIANSVTTAVQIEADFEVAPAGAPAR